MLLRGVGQVKANTSTLLYYSSILKSFTNTPSRDVTASHSNAPAVISLVSVELNTALKAGR